MVPPNFFHKPELALRRAIELQGISQTTAALELLHDVLSSRRHRTWSPVYEQIMYLYIDLCCEDHRSREAKDGLHQYRNLSQSQAPGSLEKVIQYLIDKAKQKCEAAKVESETLPDDFEASPQAVLLSTMSTDPAQAQRDSSLLLPSLKFLWETYRAVLDILRSSSKLEHVYHAAAQGALNFCKIYRRRTEFRHLCDMLRMHLGNLRQFGSFAEQEKDKSHNKVRGWEGWTSESIELNLGTRFAQLEAASVLHRYTEGFRTVEDIYNILQISQARRKTNPDVPPPKAKLMAAYYEKLTTLFWVSENHLFHGFAWYKYYSLCKEYNRSMSDEMKQLQASAVLLAALCIPPTAINSGKTDKLQHGIRSTKEDDIVKQKMARMATLLGFHTRNPTREALLNEIRSKNLLEHVPQYLRDLYMLLEVASDPLTMVEEARPLLDQLKKEVGATTATDQSNEDVTDTSLGRYVKPLTSVLLLKLMVNLSKAYHTVTIDHLKKLTSGLDIPFEQVEKSIANFAQTKIVPVRIDHRAGCLRFGDAELESDAMRSQLTVLAKQLQNVSLILNPVDPAKKAAEKKATFDEIRANLVAEHLAILERKNFIEQKKEEAERLAQEKVKEAARIEQEKAIQRQNEDKIRIEREKRQREQEKLQKIQEELHRKEIARVWVSMGNKVEDLTDEMYSTLDIETLQKEQQAKINKEKEEADRKTKEVAKKLDYLVRAIRIEELPLLKKKHEEQRRADRERYEQETKEKAEKAKKQWEADVKDKVVLEEHKVFDHFAAFEELVLEGRRAIHEALCEEADRMAEAEAERAKLDRARKRRDAELKHIADEENRKKEEEERSKAEEEARKKDEARREKEAKEEEARQAELRRMDEERRKGDRRGGGGGSYVPPSRRGEGGGSGGGVDDRNSRYPGGGRYEGRSGGQGGDRDRGGGYGDRGGYGSRDRDRDRGGGSSGGGAYVPPSRRGASGGGRDNRGSDGGQNSRWR